VRSAADLLLAALHSAAETLAGHDVRFEAFARLGESVQLHRERDASVEKRSSREFGVACRVAGGGRAGFAAASGSGARAGRDAARAALATMRPAADPLPPRSVLGSSGTALPFRTPDVGQLAALVEDVAGGFAAGRHGVTLVQIRGLAGSSAAAIATGEGHHALASAGGAVLELLLAPREGPWRHFHFAAPALADLDAAVAVERAREAALLATRGTPPERQLTDVLLAPAVAAPLVVALAQDLTADRGRPPGAKVARAWRLVDDRPGPAGLLPLPWDGEGLPSRRIELIGDGTVHEPLATWADAARTGGTPGGAVRPSYRHPPHAGPANLVVRPERALPQTELFARLEQGFYLAAPAGAVQLDAASGRFVLRAAAVAIRHGKPVAAHPLVTLRGSLRRLLGALVATGGDSESFSLACAVTTPSLLVHGLEIA
jgi:predicted Zn-dependent protease